MDKLMNSKNRRTGSKIRSDLFSSQTKLLMNKSVTSKIKSSNSKMIWREKKPIVKEMNKIRTGIVIIYSKIKIGRLQGSNKLKPNLKRESEDYNLS